MSSREITAKRLRGGWADSNRSIYLAIHEVERSFKKDPVGKEYMISLLQTIAAHLRDEDKALEDPEDREEAIGLTGLSNYNAETYERKFTLMLPGYNKLLAKDGYEATLTKRRRIVAQRVEGERSA